MFYLSIKTKKNFFLTDSLQNYIFYLKKKKKLQLNDFNFLSKLRAQNKA